MARMSLGQKAERVLRLLLGMRDARVVEALRQYGFTQQDLDDGWERLRNLTDGRLAVRLPMPPDPTLIEQLDAWENRWFPIASASLRSRHPDAHAWLFLNLSQTSGEGVVITVGKLAERLERLPEELGDEGRAARALLEKRGLDAERIADARRMLERIGSAAPAPEGPLPDPEEVQQAEEHMWNWYLEWGEIARVAITNRRLLRKLGYLQNSGGSSAPDSDELALDDADAEANDDDPTPDSPATNPQPQV